MSKTTTTAAEDQNDDTAGWFIVNTDLEPHTVTDNDDFGFRGFPEIYQTRWEAETAAMELAEREHPNDELEMTNAYINIMIGPPQHHTVIKNADDRILCSIVPAEYSG